MQKMKEDGSGDAISFQNRKLQSPTQNECRRRDLSNTLVTTNTKSEGKSEKQSSLLLKTSWTLRSIFSIILLIYFWFTVYCGPIMIIGTTIAIQAKCFKEIVNVASKMYPRHLINRFKQLSCYFLIVFNYFFLGETLVNYFSEYTSTIESFKVIINYHRFICFCIYLLGVMWFVANLGFKYEKEQFVLLGWTQVALVLLVSQSYMIVRNIFQGMIWLVIPVTGVVVNDTMAFVCGKFFGKTPLIKVSPKKTWEGFLGAGFFTILYCWLISNFLCQFEYFICPIQYKMINGNLRMITSCTPSYLFHWTSSEVNFNVFDLFDVLIRINYYPFTAHSLCIALFSSFIAPFGGFFASGFKRAFKIKDFGSTIPGHGGILDRFDCQFLVATFVNVYIYSFIESYNVENILERIYKMSDKQQLDVLRMLENNLEDTNCLPDLM